MVTWRRGQGPNKMMKECDGEDDRMTGNSKKYEAKWWKEWNFFLPGEDAYPSSPLVHTEDDCRSCVWSVCENIMTLNHDIKTYVWLQPWKPTNLYKKGTAFKYTSCIFDGDSIL